MNDQTGKAIEQGQGAAGAAPAQIIRKTAAQILALNDREQFDVDMRRWWGCVVTVREPDALTASMILTSCTDADGKTDRLEMFAKLIQAQTIDPETGEQLFSPGQVEALKLRSSGAIVYLGQRIQSGKKDTAPSPS